MAGGRAESLVAAMKSAGMLMSEDFKLKGISVHGRIWRKSYHVYLLPFVFVVRFGRCIPITVATHSIPSVFFDVIIHFLSTFELLLQDVVTIIVLIVRTSGSKRGDNPINGKFSKRTPFSTVKTISPFGPFPPYIPFFDLLVKYTLAKAAHLPEIAAGPSQFLSSPPQYHFSAEAGSGRLARLPSPPPLME